MVERITDLPDNVLGFTAKGTVTAEDYETQIIPAVEEMLARHETVRLLYHLGEEFEHFEAGAMWDDAKIGLKHLRAWERMAVVTDVGWIRGVLRIFAVAIPGHVRVFHDSELAEARAWVSE